MHPILMRKGELLGLEGGVTMPASQRELEMRLFILLMITHVAPQYCCGVCGGGPWMHLVCPERPLVLILAVTAAAPRCCVHIHHGSRPCLFCWLWAGGRLHTSSLRPCSGPELSQRPLQAAPPGESCSIEASIFLLLPCRPSGWS